MQKKFINQYSVVLFLLILFYVSNNIYFLYQDQTPLVWEAIQHHKTSVENYGQFKQGNILGLFNQYLFFNGSPLAFYPSFFLYPFFGTSQDVTAFQGTIFLVILIIATYLLGKELFNKNVGLLSAVLISFSPLILAISKIPYEDIAFVALFTLTLYFFVKSKKFSDIKYTWLFNVSLGMTLLSKLYSIVNLFFIFFTFFLLILIFDRTNLKKFFSKWNKKNIIHFIISFLVSMILPLINYLILLTRRVSDIFIAYNIQGTGFFNFRTLSLTIFNYFRTVVFNFGYTPIFILFVIAFVFFLLFSKRNKLFILSLIIGANLYHLLFLLFFTDYIEYITRYLAFIKPIYIIVLSVFLITYPYNIILKILKKNRINFFSKEKYVLYLIIISFIVLIPLTLVFNYNNEPTKTDDLYPVFGKNHPLKYSHDIQEILDELSIITEYENQTIFVFSEKNLFVDIIYFYFSENNRVEVITLFDEPQGFMFVDKYEKPLDKYNHIIENNSIQYTELETFNFVIISEEFIGNHSKEYMDYHSKILLYFNEMNKYELFKEINIDYINITVSIYKIKR